MKKIVLASLFAVSLVMPLSAMPVGALTPEVQQGYLSVSYTEEKEVSPDTVELSVSVKTEDKKSMQLAVQKNKEISDKVYNYMKGFINTANGDYIKTSNYSASPNYLYDNNGKRSFDKYQVSNNVIIHTKAIDKIGSLIDKSIELGATDVDSLDFSLSNKDAICSDLLTSAAKKSKQRAVSIATAIGSTITGVKNISTSCNINDGQRPVYRANKMMLMSASADGVQQNEPSTAIESGTIKVYSSINADFYVK